MTSRKCQGLLASWWKDGKCDWNWDQAQRTTCSYRQSMLALRLQHMLGNDALVTVELLYQWFLLLRCISTLSSLQLQSRDWLQSSKNLVIVVKRAQTHPRTERGEYEWYSATCVQTRVSSQTPAERLWLSVFLQRPKLSSVIVFAALSSLLHHHVFFFVFFALGNLQNRKLSQVKTDVALFSFSSF